MARYAELNPISPDLLLANIEKRGVDPQFALRTSLHPLALVTGNMMARYNSVMRAKGQKGYSIVTYPAEVQRIMAKMVYHPLDSVLAVREETLPVREISKVSYPIWQQRLPDVDAQGQKRETWIPSNASLEAQLSLLASTGLAREVASRQFELTGTGDAFLLTQPDKILRRLGANPKILYDVLWGQSNPMEEGYPKGFLRRLALLLVIAEAAPSKDSPLHIQDILENLALGKDKLAQIGEDVKRLHALGLLTYEGKTQKEMTPEYDVPIGLAEHPEQAEELLPHVRYYGCSKATTHRIREAIVSLAAEGQISVTISMVTARVNEMLAQSADVLDGGMPQEKVETALREWGHQGILTGKNLDARKQAEIYLNDEQITRLQAYVAVLKGSSLSSRRAQSMTDTPEKIASMLGMIENNFGASPGKPITSELGYDIAVGEMVQTLGPSRANAGMIARHTGFDKQMVEVSLERLAAMGVVEQEITSTGSYYQLSFPGLMEAVSTQPQLHVLSLYAAASLLHTDKETVLQEAESLLLGAEAQIQKLGIDPVATRVTEEVLQFYRDKGLFGKDPLLTKRLLRLALRVGVAITTKGELLAIGEEEIRDLISPNAGVAEMVTMHASTDPLYFVMRRSTTRRPNGTNTEMVAVTRRPDEIKSELNELRQGSQALIFKAEGNGH